MLRWSSHLTFGIGLLIVFNLFELGSIVNDNIP